MSDSLRYEVQIAPDRVVVMRQLTFEEFMECSQVAKDNQLELGQQGLRRAIVKDGATDLKYADLIGNLLSKRFTTPQMLLLRAAWEKIHAPGEEELAALKGMRVIST